ncbi:MAG: nucleotidyltransferase domain-containing protein [Holophagales bacterium]|nr:nucleotidyltransferase domain-containing protein [Holophagales bacterium]
MNRGELPTSLRIDPAELRRLCRKWQIEELALFGSVLRPDFDDSSDIDLLLTFADAAPWNLLDLVRLRSELRSLLGRPVDLVEKRSLRNPYRRREIERDARVVYSAA